MSLHDPIRYLPGVGPRRASLFSSLNINTIHDLLCYFPRRYEDRRKFHFIKDINDQGFYNLKVRILNVPPSNPFRKGKDIFTIKVCDDSGQLDCVWFNQSYLRNYFKIGQNLVLYGKINFYKNRIQMQSAEYEIIQDPLGDSLSVGRIVPIYSLTKGVTQRYLRKIISYSLTKYLPTFREIFSYSLRKKYNLINIALAIKNIHFPDKFDLLEESKKRIGFEEFFLFEMMLLLRKLRKKSNKGLDFHIEPDFLKAFINSLSFKLTGSQEEVLCEIINDLSKPFAMYRLLQGDVGCGKTIVALIASFVVLESGYQVAFMVPTEILAKQHFEKIQSHFNNFTKRRGKRILKNKINIALVTSSLKKKERDKVRQDIKSGKLNLIIGTHALIQSDLDFKNLGLVIVDEQHKFGVGQRALLSKKGASPDVLVMTATPIPRTLAMTLYGDLDISTITQLPEGRIPVETKIFTQEQRQDLYQFIKKNLLLKRQAYIVYPIIEESASLDLLAAEQMFKHLKEDVFGDFTLGLIHGRIKEETQVKIMQDFRYGKIDILVSTTVLEVGVDVPNASIMVIEHAERFGLSQLHQLRGRVGRGKEQSFCILVSDSKSNEAGKRLNAMISTNDGFKIAQQDLEIRGPGEFFGKEQHGQPGFLVVDPLKHLDLLKMSREEALNILRDDINLLKNENSGIRNSLRSKYSLNALTQAD